MRSCCDTAPAVRSICPRETNKPFQFWLCPWLLTNKDIKKKKVLEWIMACTAGPLSCSRIISMEPDRAGWRGWMQKKRAFHLSWKKENTSRWTELFHYSWALQLVNVVICLWYICGTRKMFSVWQKTNRKLALQAVLWTAALSCSLITNPGVLRWENWHHPPPFQSLFSLWNMTDLLLPFFQSWEGEEGEELWSMRELWTRRLGPGLNWPLNDAAGSA